MVAWFFPCFLVKQTTLGSKLFRTRGEPIPGVGLAWSRIFWPFLDTQVRNRLFFPGAGSLDSASPGCGWRFSRPFKWSLLKENPSTFAKVMVKYMIFNIEFHLLGQLYSLDVKCCNYYRGNVKLSTPISGLAAASPTPTPGGQRTCPGIGLAFLRNRLTSISHLIILTPIILHLECRCSCRQTHDHLE